MLNLFHFMLIFGSIFCGISLLYFIWSEFIRVKKYREFSQRLSERYPGCLIMITSQGGSIYLVGDRVWVDSKYIEEYISTHHFSFMVEKTQKVNWQKEGF